MQPSPPREDEDPGLDGPDYLALVIEWTEPAQAANEEASEDASDEASELSDAWARYEAVNLWADDATRQPDVAHPEPHPPPEIGPPEHRLRTSRTIAAVLGALGALALAAWGIRRLRTS